LPNFIKVGVLAFCAVWFVVTLSVAASNRNTSRYDNNGNPATTGNVAAALALTGLCLGVVAAGAGAAFAFLDDIWNLAVVKIAWTALALVALWFIAGAVGIWADTADSVKVDPARWRAEMALEIIGCVIWVFAIAFVLVDPLDGGGNEVPKFPAFGVLAALAVFAIITMSLQAADRAGHAGSSVQNSVIVASWQTNPLWTGWGLAGSLTALLVALIGLGAVATDNWGKDEATFRYVRFLWVVLAGAALFFLGGIVGIWARYQNTVGNTPAQPFSPFMRAEFSFEIITSVLVIAAVVVMAAIGAGAGAKSS